jgi:hypothetical protein
MFVATVAAVLAAWLFVRVSAFAALPALAVAVSAALAAMVRANLLRPFNRAWAFLGHLLGAFMSPIVMGVLFFGVITPIALLMRVAGRDELRLRIVTGPTCWRDRNPPGPPAETLRRQY